ncbi:Phosphorylated carbohydrates phosphatase [Hordeum vulgare]|nr:Phosphorylated carbohydrates phosphatase [Hordeum vulgare]
MLTKPDEDECLLAWVYHWSLTTAETGARRLQRKNAKALRLAIEQPKREAKEAAMEAAREKDRAVCRVKGLVVLSDSDDEDSDSCSSSSFDQDPSLAANGYNYAGDRKGKGLTRKWWSRTPTPLFISFLVVEI